MNTHYHLVIETSRVSVFAGLKRLNGLYAQGFNGATSEAGTCSGIVSGRVSLRPRSTSAPRVGTSSATRCARALS